MDEVATVFHSTAVLNQITFEITRRRIAPLGEGPHWYALPDRRARAPAAPAHTSGGFAFPSQHPIDGGGADIQEPASYHRVQLQMAVALHRLDQYRDEFCKTLAADAIGCLPQHD